MVYQDIYNAIIPYAIEKNTNEKGEVDREAIEKFIAENFQRNAAVPSVEEINKKLSRSAAYDGPLMKDKFTPAEKQARADLGARIRKKMADYALDHCLNGHDKALPLIADKIKTGDKTRETSGDRYPEEFLYDFSGTPEAIEKNAEITALFINAKDAALKLKPGESNPYEAQINKIHEEMISRLESYNVDELLSRDLSDEELVESFERIEECKALNMQIENIHNAYREMKIPVPEKLAERMEAMKPNFRILEKYEQRLGMIDSPYYQVLDVDDPDVISMTGNYDADDAMGGDEVDPELKKFNLSKMEYTVFSSSVSSFDGFYYMAENEAMGEMLQQMGAKREDIVFEIDGKLSKTPYYQSGEGMNFPADVFSRLNSGEIKSARIYDKNDPTREIKIPKTTSRSYQFNKMLLGKMPMKEPPQPPAEVPRPGFFKRLFNSMFGAFQKDVDAYQKYQDDLAAYPKKMETFEKEKSALEGLEKNFKEKKAEIEKLKAVQPSKEIEKGMERMLSVYSNTPKYMPENKGFYKGMEEGRDFSELEAFDIEGITVGGEQVTEMEFAALAMAGAMQPGSGATNVIRQQEDRQNYDEDYLSTSNATMYTADIAYGRDKCVGMFFDGIKNGRIAAQQALLGYKYGNPEEMADLLAGAMVRFEAWIREAGTGTAATVCPIEFFSKMAGLLEKDENLKNLVGEKMDALQNSFAEKEKAFDEKQKASLEKVERLSKDVNGMALPGSEYDKAMEEYEVNRTAYDHYRGLNATNPSLDKAMKDMKAYRKVNELNEKANKARETIKEAAISGKKLDPEIKKQCLKDILRVAAMDACLQIQRNDSQKIAMDFVGSKQELLMKDVMGRTHIIGAFSTANQFAESKPVSIMEQLSGKNGMENLDIYVEHSVRPEIMEKWMNMPEKDLLLTVKSQSEATNMLRDEKAAMAKEQKVAREKEMQKAKAMEKQKEAPTNEKKATDMVM